MANRARIIEGGRFNDDRGSMIFANAFDMSPVKRFYITTPSNNNPLRAWQGHKVEQKWFFCLVGSFEVKLMKPDDWNNPANDLTMESFLLKDDESSVLQIPSGFINGFKSIKPGSKMMIYSSLNLEDSKADDYRFPSNYWIF